MACVTRKERALKKYAVLRIIVIYIIIMLSIAVIKMNFTIRISDYPDSVWESDAPYFQLTFADGNVDTAYMEINGEIVKVDFAVAGGGNSRRTVITDYVGVHERGTMTDKVLIDAQAEFSFKEIIINIEKDNVYNYKYSQIVLHRIA